jgi:hypothetical protein
LLKAVGSVNPNVNLLVGLLNPPDAQACVSNGLIKGVKGSAAAHQIKKPKAPAAKLLGGLTPAFGKKQAGAKAKAHSSASRGGR